MPFSTLYFPPLTWTYTKREGTQSEEMILIEAYGRMHTRVTVRGVKWTRGCGGRRWRESVRVVSA